VPESYWLSDAPETQAEDARLLRTSKPWLTAVSILPKPEADMARISVAAKGGEELFSNLAGVLAAQKNSIIDARSFKLSDGRQLNSFVVDTPPDNPYRLAGERKGLETEIARVVGGGDPGFRGPPKSGLLSDKLRYFPVAPRIKTSNDLSADYTVIEVSTRDRIGLLYDLTRVLIGHGCAIFSAHVATYGARAVDVFYIHSFGGNKITDKKKLKDISADLMTVIDPKKETKD